MTAIRRRTLLAALAAAGGSASVAGCLSDGGGDGNGNGDSDGFEERVVLDRTVTPSSDGNPLTLPLDADPGTVLKVEVEYDEAAVAAVVHGDTGVLLDRSGTGDWGSGRESAPLPDSSEPNALALAMHESDQVDLTVTAVDEGSPADVTSPEDRLVDGLEAVTDTVASADDERTAAVVGPLWLWLFETATGNAPDSPGTARAALDSAAADVYGALARQRADAWATGSVGTVADLLASAATTAVAAKTGIPAFLVEDSLQSSIEDALRGDRVSWRYGDPDPASLDVSGGDTSIVATVTADLTVEGVGIVLDAPVELRFDVDGASIPANATVTDSEALVDQVDVEVE